MCICVAPLSGFPPAMFKRCGSKSSRARDLPGHSEIPNGPGIHVLLLWTNDGERYLSHTGGAITAEELCISAARAVGEQKHFFTFFLPAAVLLNSTIKHTHRIFCDHTSHSDIIFPRKKQMYCTKQWRQTEVYVCLFILFNLFYFNQITGPVHYFGLVYTFTLNNSFASFIFWIVYH